MELQLDRKVKLRELNEHITCFICSGYLIDATSIIECLHTFCKSCIVKHLEDGDNCCPKCGLLIHQSYPKQYISFDRTMQDIVDKLVPNLIQEEYKRKKRFFSMHGIQYMADQSCLKPKCIPSIQQNSNQNLHLNDEQVMIWLCRGDNVLQKIEKPYLECSVNATIKILKKFIAMKLGLGKEKHIELDLLCNKEILGRDHTLKFVLVTRWRSKPPPLLLEYQPRVTLL